MVEIVKYGEFKSYGINDKKKQIILTHTSRNIESYLQSLKYRYKVDRIPNYLISKDGEILKLLENNEYSNYFTNNEINKQAIIISLENLGWLEKEPLKDYYINWIGDIYKGKPFERKWRDYFFWDKYSDEQMESLSKLVKMLFEEFNIDYDLIDNNTKITGAENISGVITRSNFDSNITDVSPAFNYDKLIEYLI